MPLQVYTLPSANRSLTSLSSLLLHYFSIVECFTTKDCLSWSCASKDAFLQIIPAVYERNTIDTMIKRTTNLLTFKVTCMGLRKVDKTNFSNFIARWLLVCPQRWKKQNTPVTRLYFLIFFFYLRWNVFFTKLFNFSRADWLVFISRQ